MNASSLETALCLLRVYISLGLYDTTSAPSGSYCNLRMRLPTIFSWQMEACRAHEEETTLSGGTAVLSDAFHEHWMWSCGSHLVSSPRNRKQVRWQQLHGLSKSRRAIAGSKLEVMTMGVEDHKNIIIKKKKKTQPSSHFRSSREEVFNPSPNEPHTNRVYLFIFIVFPRLRAPRISQLCGQLWLVVPGPVRGPVLGFGFGVGLAVRDSRCPFAATVVRLRVSSSPAPDTPTLKFIPWI